MIKNKCGRESKEILRRSSARDDSDRYGAQSSLHCKFIRVPALRGNGPMAADEPSKRKEKREEAPTNDDTMSKERGKRKAKDKKLLIERYYAKYIHATKNYYIN